MSSGTQISDMTITVSLPAGTFTPIVVTDAATGLNPALNYRFDLGTDLLTRVSYTALAANGGAALVGTSTGDTVEERFVAFGQSGGADLIGYAPSVGSDTTVQAELRKTLFLSGTGDGVTDATATLQEALDFLTDGGIINISDGIWPVSIVTVSNANITVQLSPGATVKKFGSGGISARGIFYIPDLPDAYFELRGGTIDLNGEGSQGLGVAGRIANTYGPGTVPTISAINGPLNAAVFALRSSHIKVIGTRIQNTGESGLLLRDCGNTLVEDCDFYNVSNYGVEWSFIAANQTSPYRDHQYVHNCRFVDLEDFGLGSFNGCCVGGGGSGANLGTFYDYSVTNCSFLRAQRDVNVELVSGTQMEGLLIEGNQSFDCRQGSINFAGVHGVRIASHICHNPGAAPTFVLGDNWPSTYGLSMSGDVDDISVSGLQVVDDRTDPMITDTDGAMTAGSAVFTSASATFSSDDVGKYIGVRDAVETDVALVAQIVSRQSNTQVTLSAEAQATVSGADYAYGGCTPLGIRMNGVEGAVEISDSFIKAGVSSGLAGEPDPAAILVDMTSTGVLRLLDNRLLAPTTSGDTPTGLDLTISTGPGGGTLYDRQNHITGFDDARVGVVTNKALFAGQYQQWVDTAVAPSATINTYGTEVSFTPKGDFFYMVDAMTVEYTGISAETITVQITGYYSDSTPSALTPLTASADAVYTLTLADLLALGLDNANLLHVGVKTKSSKSSSGASLKVSLRTLGE